ncbi:MAG: hypothetical protein J6Z11_11805 [Candidatus Riflebacteria bacterium]|nr:hypothetical protein [Candidatus Riflebacteria bacterium]
MLKQLKCVGEIIKKEFDLRQACFVCTTPYQIIGALSIVLCEKLKADIFICSTFKGYKELADRLKNLKVFQNVYEIDCNKIKPFSNRRHSKIGSLIQPLIQVCKPERYVSRFLDDNLTYNSFYVSSRAHIKMLMYYVLQKRNPNMRVIIFDDGLGSYQENSHALNASKLRCWVENILGLKNYDSKLVSFELYLHNMIKLPSYLKNCPIGQMPRLNWNKEENKKILKALFGIKDTEKYNEKIILFDNFRDSKSRLDLFRKIDECFEKILEIAGEDNILFKGHPRSLVSPSIPLKNTAKQGIPVEVFYSDMDDLDSRVLVAYNSTAIYTPKILFDKEPWVICLHRIVGTAPQENPEQIYQMFLSEYRNPKKLFAPKNLEELQGMLLIPLKMDKMK